jgi:hypothetical protein
MYSAKLALSLTPNTHLAVPAQVRRCGLVPGGAGIGQEPLQAARNPTRWLKPYLVLRFLNLGTRHRVSEGPLEIKNIKDVYSIVLVDVIYRIIGIN